MGHCKEIVLEAVKEACDKGMSFGAPCLAETELAKRICSLVPCVDVVRMVNSGTEATYVCDTSGKRLHGQKYNNKV